jgi:hypothetical protein
MYGNVPSEDTKNKRLATRKRNKEAKAFLEEEVQQDKILVIY